MPQFHFSDHHQSGAKTELKEGVGGWGLLKDSDIQIRSDTLNPELFVVGNKQKREEKKPREQSRTRGFHMSCVLDLLAPPHLMEKHFYYPLVK